MLKEKTVISIKVSSKTLYFGTPDENEVQQKQKCHTNETRIGEVDSNTIKKLLSLKKLRIFSSLFFF